MFKEMICIIINMFYAIEKESNLKVDSECALKDNVYLCPECKAPVIHKRESRGRRAHFAHKVLKKECSSNIITKYYKNESEEHKQCKYKLKEMLMNGITLNITQSSSKNCNSHLHHKVNKLKGDKILLEFIFNYNGRKRVADIAILDSKDNLKSILEIKRHNRTIENKRPEPWFEFSCSQISKEFGIYMKLNEMNFILTDIDLSCSRNRDCQICPQLKEGERLCKIENCSNIIPLSSSKCEYHADSEDKLPDYLSCRYNKCKSEDWKNIVKEEYDYCLSCINNDCFICKENEKYIYKDSNGIVKKYIICHDCFIKHKWKIMNLLNVLIVKIKK